MENIEKIAEEIINKLLNVKLMCSDDLKHSYNNTEDANKYFKIVDLGIGYRTIDGYEYYITCETNRWGDPKNMKMKIDIYIDGYFNIYGNYKLIKYWGKLDI